MADALVDLDQSPTPPPVAAWSEYLASISGKLAQISRCLNVPSRGGPSANQREEVRRLIGSRPTAARTDSALSRGIVTSLTWFKVSIHAFRLGEYRVASSWLERANVLALVGASDEPTRTAAGRS